MDVNLWAAAKVRAVWWQAEAAAAVAALVLAVLVERRE